MRLGFMLRNFEELGGIAVYTRELLEHLLKVDRANEYYIFYGGPEPVGTYSRHSNVHEIVVPCRSKFLWDQAQVASEAERLGIDVMFSPKMSSPLLFRGRKVFAIHGAEQFVHAKEYPLLDRLYVRSFLPLFAKTSSRVVALTETAKADLVKPLGISADRITVTHPGTKEVFLRAIDPAHVRAVRAKYGLESDYILHVGLVWGAKNFRVFPAVLDHLARWTRREQEAGDSGDSARRPDREISATPRRPVVLAHAGKSRGWVKGGPTQHARILQLGYVPDDDLAALYQGAIALVFPSLYEGFGIPLLEAMATGCPVVTTNWGAMKEVCGDAALLVDSRRPDEIARAVQRLVEEPGLREEMIRRGRERAKAFSWERTARETLAILEEVAKEPAPEWAATAPARPKPGYLAGPGALDTPAPPRRRSILPTLLKVTVSAALLGILLRQIDVRQVAATIAGARWDLLLAAFFVNHADRILQGGKWWALVRSSGVRFPFWSAIATTYAGNFAGQFLPAGVGGDVVRLVLLKRLGLPSIEVVASIVVERLFGLFALVTVASIAIAVAAALGIDLPGSIEGVTWGIFAVMAIALVASFLPSLGRLVVRIVSALSRLPFRVPFLTKMEPLFVAYARYADRPRVVAGYFFLSILEVLVLVGVNYLVCRAIGFDMPLLSMMLIVPVTLILFRIPISLNGLGVQEGMFGYFFAEAGYGVGAGVSLSLVLRLLEAGIFLPGALFLWRGRRESVEPSPPTGP